MATKSKPVEKVKAKSPTKLSKTLKTAKKLSPKTIVKKVAKAVKVKRAVPTMHKALESKNVSLKIAVLDTMGKVVGSVNLPEKIFGAKLNTHLLSQAIRVYLVNQRFGTVSTKSRGEVDGSTRKIYRQKGTGRARHGGIRAPIFVKGGVAHGPKPKEYNLSMSKKMKRAAFASSLSMKVKEGDIKVVSGIEKLDKKTKEFAKAFKNWGFSEKKRNVIFVLPKDMKDIYNAMRNLEGVKITTAGRLNTFDVLKYKTLVFMRESVDVLGGKNESNN